jgi:hypothetical protein
MSISPICDFCKKELTDFGGLIYPPPESLETGGEHGQTEKLHVCNQCYQGMRSMFVKDLEGAALLDTRPESMQPLDELALRKKYEDMIKSIKVGMYKDTKTGNLYRVVGIGKNTETLEDIVVYKQAENIGTSELLARPAKIFVENILVNEEYVPRFVFVSATL